MENTKVKAPKQHKLTEKHPILSAVLFGYAAIFLTENLIGIIGIIVHKLIPAYPQSGGPVEILAFGLLWLLYYKHYFKPEFEGCLKGGDLKTGFLLILIQAGYTLIVGCKDLLSGCVFHVPTFVSLSTALMAGFIEEIAFRGTLVSTLMRQWKRDENKILTAAIVSAVAFAMIHAVNVFAGAPVSITIFQVVLTSFIGLFLAAVYLRSGNLLPVAAGHFFHDVISYVISAPDSSELLIMNHGIDASLWIECGMSIVLAGIGIWLLRKEKRGEILQIWQAKWADPETMAD